MPVPQRPAELTSAAHEHIYRTLRTQIMHGEISPGRAVTLRGLAHAYGVSMTPVREALRRLAAEGAVTLSPSGRAATADPSPERIEELAAIRALLESELAARALPRAHEALIRRMQAINNVIAQSIERHDAVGYIRANLEFHRSLYLRAQAPAMLAMAETVWLQLGPKMCDLYGSLKRTEPPGNHRVIIAALRAGDEHALRAAVSRDVTQGLRMLVG